MANWTPAALGALDRLRWDFLDSASVTAVSGAASKIANKGSLGTGGDLLQATSAKQPAYSGGVLTTNGTTFLVTNGLLASSIYSNLQTGIFYGIVRYVSGSVWFNCEISGGGANRFGAEGSARVDWPNGDSNTGSAQNFSPNLTTSRIIVVQKTTTSLNIRVSGTQVASRAETLSNTNATAGVALGAQNSGNFPGAAEFKAAFGCIDDASLDTAQRVEGWLAWRMPDAGDASYVANLPANHPYKAAAPTVDTGGATTNASLSATEAQDTAAFSASASAEAALVASEQADAATLAGSTATTAVLNASEPTDTAAVTSSNVLAATLAATDARDTAVIAGASTSQVVLAATEPVDGPSFSGALATNAALVRAEAADSAAITGNLGAVPVGTLIATEFADTAVFTGSVVAAATLSAVDTQDTATVVYATPIQGVLFVTEPTDIASFTVYIPAHLSRVDQTGGPAFLRSVDRVSPGFVRVS